MTKLYIDNKKITELDFESNKRSIYDVDELRFANTPPPFNRNLYLNKGSNFPANIITLRDTYVKRTREQPEFLNDDDDGRNIAWLNMTKRRINVSEYLVSPENISKVPKRTPQNAPKVYKPINLIVS